MSRRLSRYLLASAFLLVVALLVRRTLGLREEERRVVPSIDPWPPIREAEAEAVTAAVAEAPPAAAVVEAVPAVAAMAEAAAAAVEAAPAAATTTLPIPPPPVARTTPVVAAPTPTPAVAPPAAPAAPHPSVAVDTAAPDAAATWAAPVADSCPDGYPIKAKATSGIYHLPGMANYSRTRPDRCYASEEAAIEDGFVKAKR